MRKAFLTNLTIISVLACVCRAEFRVNTHTTWDQKDAAIAIDANGNFIVVWNSYRQDGDSGGIFGQRFSSTGQPAGSEFQINTITAGNQARPAAAMDAAGNFVVAWQGPGVSDEDVFAQRFAADGQPLGLEFQVNSYAHSQQLYAGIAGSAGGQFVAVWQSKKTPQDANRTSICGQLYDSAGWMIGPEFTISEAPANCRYPAAAMDDSGNFAVVWMEEDGSNKIMVRLYNADGTVRTEPLQVNTVRFSSITQPSIAMASSGRFAITWDGDPNRASDDDIHARLYQPDGTPMSEQFVVNTTRRSSQQNPRVAMNNWREFVIVWESRVDPNVNERDIFGQRYDSAGLPIGGEFQVNTFAAGDQRNAAAAMDRAGRFVTVWQSDGQDGSGYGIFAEMGSLVDSANLNSDGSVDFYDFCILASQWQQQGNSLSADLLVDDRIDHCDLAAFCRQWLTAQVQ